MWACGIEGIVESTRWILCFLRMRFCGIVESSVDSAVDSANLPFLVDWSWSRERGFYFWQKPKVAKTFTHFVRDSAESWNLTQILHFAFNS